MLSEAEYEKHLSVAFPNARDERVLSEIFKDKDRVLRMNLRFNSSIPSADKENP